MVSWGMLEKIQRNTFLFCFYADPAGCALLTLRCNIASSYSCAPCVDVSGLGPHQTRIIFFMPKLKGAAVLVDTVDKYRMVDKTA
jgi:hypothetical protein